MIDNSARDQEGSSQLIEWLSSFSCERDKDIGDFLHNRAIPFEIAKKSRTYLLVDEVLLLSKGQMRILGFFTVSLKVLDLPERLSNRKRLELDGFAAKIHGEPIKSIPCYLIGQLAKNSAVQDSVSGALLLDEALSIIKSAVKRVGGRFVLVECRDDPHLRRFYSDNRFDVFDTIPDEHTPMLQMIFPLYEAT